MGKPLTKAERVARRILGPQTLEEAWEIAQEHYRKELTAALFKPSALWQMLKDVSKK